MKKYLEPGLFDIIINGRNRKPTLLFKYIEDNKYELIVLEDFYRLSENPGAKDIYFIDPSEGPFVTVGCDLSNEYYDESKKKWMPEKPERYTVTALYHNNARDKYIVELNKIK